MSDVWSPPWPITGNPGHVRVSVSLLGDSGERHCPEHRALKSRPGVWPQTPFTTRRNARYATFLIGVIRDAVLAVEQGDVPADPLEPWRGVAVRSLDHVLAAGLVKGEVPEAARRWVRHAIETYLETSEALNRADGLVPGPRDGWVVTGRREQEISELAAWGLTYASGDGPPAGRVRELRLLRVRPAADRRPMPQQARAAAAFVAATGMRTLTGGDWWDPYEPATPPDPVPALVRVREVALLDGSDQLVWEGTPDEAKAAWAPFGSSLVRPLVSGGALLPCRDCDRCKARPVCEALPLAPGLLGLPGFGTHPRSLAPSALDLWARCPARYLYAKELGLPRARTVSSAALERGNAVHRWLEHAHRRGIPCIAGDLPRPLAPASGRSGDVDDSPDATLGDVAAAAELNFGEYTAAYPYLGQHLEVCPLVDESVLDVWPERDLAVFDSDADVLVLHRPDVLVSRTSGPLWRETKSVARLPEASDTDLLANYPQVAVAVCVLADDASGEPRLTTAGATSAVVELELLGPSASRLVAFDALDEATVAAARRGLARAAYGWHRDEEFTPRPGVWCQGCEVNRWCPAAQLDGPAPRPAGPSTGPTTVTVDDVTVDTATGEVLDQAGQPRTPTAREAAIAASILGAPGDPNEEIPF